MATPVQSTAAGATGHAASTVNVTFGSSAVAGNHIVVDGASWDSLAAVLVNTVADNKGNGNYSIGKELTFDTQIRLVQYYKNAIATGGASFQVTITWANPCNSSISIHEYSGVAAGVPTSTSNVGTSTTASSGAVNPAGTNLYHATGAYNGGSSIANSAPWNSRSVVDSGSVEQDHAGEDQIITGSQNGAWAIGTSLPWGGIICAYADAAVTPPNVGILPRRFHPGRSAGQFGTARFLKSILAYERPIDPQEFVTAGQLPIRFHPGKSAGTVGTARFYKTPRATTGGVALNAYTFAADAGSYILTGSLATLIAARMINAVSGSYSLTGASLTMLRGRFINAQSGVYVITGFLTKLLATRLVNAGPGTYTLTGAAATLASGKKFNAASGTYVITGAVAGLPAGRKVNAAPGVYLLTGSPASLIRGRVIAATAGVYTITGAAAGRLKASVLQATAGVYVISGVSATLQFTGAGSSTYTLALDPGAYVISGSAAVLRAVRKLNLAPGMYLITGAAARARLELDQFHSESGGSFIVIVND